MSVLEAAEALVEDASSYHGEYATVSMVLLDQLKQAVKAARDYEHQVLLSEEGR